MFPNPFDPLLRAVPFFLATLRVLAVLKTTTMAEDAMHVLDDRCLDEVMKHLRIGTNDFLCRCETHETHLQALRCTSSRYRAAVESFVGRYSSKGGDIDLDLDKHQDIWRIAIDSHLSTNPPPTCVGISGNEKAGDLTMALFLCDPAVRHRLRSVESIFVEHDALRAAHVELARGISDASTASTMDIHISTERRWPSPSPNVLRPLCNHGTLTTLVLTQYMWNWGKVDLEAALFSPEFGLDVSFAEVAEFLPALQSLDIMTLQRPERVMEAIGRHLVNLRTLNLCILFNQNWADEFMRRGGQPIRSETVPASADFREQFLSIVQEAELSRMRATPLLDPLRNLTSLRDIRVVLDAAHIQCCDRVLDTPAYYNRWKDIQILEVDVLGLFRDLNGDVMLKYSLGLPEDEAWLNPVLPPIRLGATPPSLEKLTVGEFGGHVTWCTADGPIDGMLSPYGRAVWAAWAADRVARFSSGHGLR